MEEDTLVLLDNLSNLLDRLDRPDFVVDEHDLRGMPVRKTQQPIKQEDNTHRDKARVGPDRLLELLEVDEAVLLDGEVGDVEALVLQDTARVEHTLVLSLSGDAVMNALGQRGEAPSEG